ncbi:hypothetical protein BS78_08G022900 [Paspalum vaginatum]|nr:hypothetical protein BS78_08G022900 [Paspalum vaginatum]
MMMRRRSSGGVSSPFAAGALLLLLLLAASCFLLHGAAAARPMPAAAGVVPPLEDGPAQVVAADGLVAPGNGAGADVDELSVSELMGAAAACDDDCMQRRLLRDAHLDYIYTQHKGKP